MCGMQNRLNFMFSTFVSLPEQVLFFTADYLPTLVMQRSDWLSALLILLADVSSKLGRVSCRPTHDLPTGVLKMSGNFVG